MGKKVDFKDKSFNLVAIIFFLLSIFWHPQNMVLKTSMGIAWVILIAYYIMVITRWVIRKKEV